MFDFTNLLPNVDGVVNWYLNETVYCLVTYLDYSTEDAIALVIESKSLRETLEEEPGLVTRETGYYWAMHLTKQGMWWKDKVREQQLLAYTLERHKPPRGSEDNQE